MENEFKKIATAVRDIRMTSEEHRALKHTVTVFAQQHPIARGFRSVFVRHAFAYSLAACVLLAGGATAIANHAGPGDFLYPIRLAVNDKVSVVVSGDEDAKIQTELDQLDRMLTDENRAADDEFIKEGADFSVEVSNDGGTTEDARLNLELKTLENDLHDEDVSADASLEI